MILFTGFFLVFPNFVSLALLIMMTLAAHLQVRIEKRVLDRDLGADYRSYRNKVRRWI